MRYVFVITALFASPAWGASYTINNWGIDSEVLGLDGTGIEIGQVEGKRPGKPGYDTNVNLFASNTIPTQVYFQGPTFGGVDGINSSRINDHATTVAGVMIAMEQPDPNLEGVAPNANLHSLSVNSIDPSVIALGLNRIATLGGANVDVRAINMSFGIDLPFYEKTDGDSHLTQFVDWSASEHDVLYVASWPNNDIAVKSAPSDNFNGMTIASSESSGGFEYRKFADINAPLGAGFDADGPRTSIDLLAPGKNINVFETGDQGQDHEVTVSGASLAAPHVTGAVALLQQFSQQQIDNSVPRFDDNSQRHEVMKAVMLNSADKLNGVHGSKRTVIDDNDQDWTDSEAFGTQFLSLDDKMGAGHLNVRRAKQQLESGEYDPGTVPLIGWDYGNIGGPGLRREYVFDEPLAGDEFIAITLTWDRRVEITGFDDTYNQGDQFFGYDNIDEVLNNLDLYLLRADGTDLVLDSVSRSTTFRDNVEHIFFSNFPAGEYKIVDRSLGRTWRRPRLCVVVVVWITQSGRF